MSFFFFTLLTFLNLHYININITSKVVNHDKYIAKSVKRERWRAFEQFIYLSEKEVAITEKTNRVRRREIGAIEIGEQERRSVRKRNQRSKVPMQTRVLCTCDAVHDFDTLSQFPFSVILHLIMAVAFNTFIHCITCLVSSPNVRVFSF